MKRLILDKESATNLLNMCTSQDKDNWYIALKTINELNIQESLGYILTIHKFSKIPTILWIECPNAHAALSKLNILGRSGATTSKVLNTMITQKVSIESIAMFLELHNESILKNLRSWGYNTSILKINVELKKQI